MVHVDLVLGVEALPAFASRHALGVKDVLVPTGAKVQRGRVLDALVQIACQGRKWRDGEAGHIPYGRPLRLAIFVSGQEEPRDRRGRVCRRLSPGAVMQRTGLLADI